jgi:hypothetical protein
VAVATELGRQNVPPQAGQKILGNGSQLVADQNLVLGSGGGITIAAAQNITEKFSISQSTRKGLTRQ